MKTRRARLHEVVIGSPDSIDDLVNFAADGTRHVDTNS